MELAFFDDFELYVRLELFRISHFGVKKFALLAFVHGET